MNCSFCAAAGTTMANWQRPRAHDRRMLRGIAFLHVWSTLRLLRKALLSGASVDHLVGAKKHRRRNRNTKFLCRPEIQYELKVGNLLNREIGRLSALEQAVDIGGCAADGCRRRHRSGAVPHW